MKKLMTLALGLLLVMGLAGPASAYYFDMGSQSSIDVSGTSDPGLELEAYVNYFLQFQSYDLDSGGTWSYKFGTIKTTEWWPDQEDFEDQAITANIDFDIPSIFPSVDGIAVAWGSLDWGEDVGWEVTWADPVVVDLGNGDWLSIQLSDIDDGGWWCGARDVYLTVTYTHTAVPVPAAVWLLGSGLVGLAGLRRKFR